MDTVHTHQRYKKPKSKHFYSTVLQFVCSDWSLSLLSGPKVCALILMHLTFFEILVTAFKAVVMATMNNVVSSVLPAFNVFTIICLLFIYLCSSITLIPVIIHKCDYISKPEPHVTESETEKIRLFCLFIFISFHFFFRMCRLGYCSTLPKTVLFYQKAKHLSLKWLEKLSELTYCICFL